MKIDGAPWTRGLAAGVFATNENFVATPCLVSSEAVWPAAVDVLQPLIVTG